MTERREPYCEYHGMNACRPYRIGNCPDFEVGQYVTVKGDPFKDLLRIVRVDHDAWGGQVLTVREGKPCEDGATFRINEHMVEDV